MLKKVDIVVFDFDGTLSKSDSNLEFYKYCFKHSIRPWLFLPWILLCATGAIFNYKSVWWREKVRCFMTPKMVEDFKADVVKQHKQNRFGWAKEIVNKERSRGNVVLLISAGPDFLVPDLVDDIKFDGVICSKMGERKPYKYRFLCWGYNKVIAMDNWAKEHKCIPNLVRAYSDSKSDLPIMSIAKENIWIDRKTGLRK